MSKPLKIAVTGATGFIGIHLMEALNDKAYSIVGLSRKNHDSTQDNLIWKTGDITDKTSIKGMLDGVDVLIHMAAELKNESKLDEVNHLGTKNILEEAVRAGVKKIIHLSSVGVYGISFSNKTVKVDESCACHPKIPYEVTKLKAEQIAKEICANNNIPLVILRPTNVYGEHHPRKILLSLMSRISRSPLFFLSKKSMVNYLYIKDLTYVIKESLQKEITGEFNIGHPIALSEFVKIIARKSSNNIRLINVPSFVFTFLGSIGISKFKALSNQVEYSDDKIRKTLEMPYGPIRGIEKTYNYYKREVFDK
ncbi:MAG: NAD-dependent epimerase/dehydratase family protein [Bacteroidia bacterium]